MESKIKDKNVDALYKAVLTLKTEDECYRFFEDICTVQELKSIAQRLQVAKQLQEEKTYAVIEENTKVSTATISRINRSLHYGADGYKLVLARLKKS